MSMAGYLVEGADAAHFIPTTGPGRTCIMPVTEGDPEAQRGSTADPGRTVGSEHPPRARLALQGQDPPDQFPGVSPAP